MGEPGGAIAHLAGIMPHDRVRGTGLEGCVVMGTVTDGMVASELRVRYAETDAMGLVYYANYLVWFELGRTEWIRAHGVTYREFEEHGILLPVVHASCDYRRSARYDDLIRIETTVTKLTRASVAFAYRVLRAEPGPQELLVEGRTEHAFMSREGRVTRLDRNSPFWTTLAAALATTAAAS
jgi:acyl-CoA thioester hydrolase